jgi:hypothetical protein
MKKRPTEGVMSAERISLSKGNLEIFATALYIPK